MIATRTLTSQWCLCLLAGTTFLLLLLHLTMAETLHGDDDRCSGGSKCAALGRSDSASNSDGGSDDETATPATEDASDSDDSDDSDGDNDDSTSMNCVSTQVCRQVDVLQEQNAAAADRISRALASLDVSELERSVRALIADANLFLGGQTAGLPCLAQAITIGPTLLLMTTTQLDFTVLLLDASGAPVATTPAVALNGLTASVRFAGAQLLSFLGLQVDLVFDGGGALVRTEPFFFAATQNGGAAVLLEAAPFPFPFLVQRCQLQPPLVCGANVVQPTDPPSPGDIPDIPDVQEADVNPVIAFLALQRCPP